MGALLHLSSLTGCKGGGHDTKNQENSCGQVHNPTHFDVEEHHEEETILSSDEDKNPCTFPLLQCPHVYIAAKQT